MSETKLIQAPRVSVSRQRTINLGRFGLQYEKEEIFISLQGDYNSQEDIENLLGETERLLDQEVKSIEKIYEAKAPKGK